MMFTMLILILALHCRLEAVWDFYCGGSPPYHISALNRVGDPPVEYYEVSNFLQHVKAWDIGS